MSMKNEGAEDRGMIEISEEECKGCGLCIIACPPDVMCLSETFNSRGYHPARYLGSGCTGCGICFFACPEPGAITVYTLRPPAKAAEAASSSQATTAL